MKIKIITGMFKMDVCDIWVSDDTVVISASENKRCIPIASIENISVTRHANRNTRLEISLENDIIEGVFTNTSDADEFANILKECMGSVLQINFYGQ